MICTVLGCPTVLIPKDVVYPDPHMVLDLARRNLDESWTLSRLHTGQIPP